MWQDAFAPIAGMTREGLHSPVIAVAVLLTLIGLFAVTAVRLAADPRFASRPAASCPVSCRKRSSGAVAAWFIARATIAASSADSQPHPWKNHRPPGERCRATSSNWRPSTSVRLSQATGSPSCGLRVSSSFDADYESCKRPRRCP